MPMHPLSFGGIEEQALNSSLSLIHRPRSFTTDIRPRRFPDVAVHEFDRSARRRGPSLGLGDRVAAVLV